MGDSTNHQVRDDEPEFYIVSATGESEPLTREGVVSLLTLMAKAREKPAISEPKSIEQNLNTLLTWGSIADGNGNSIVKAWKLERVKTRNAAHRADEARAVRRVEDWVGGAAWR